MGLFVHICRGMALLGLFKDLIVTAMTCSAAEKKTFRMFNILRWGEDGYIRLARGDQCGTDSKPLDGTGCVNGPGSDVS